MKILIHPEHTNLCYVLDCFIYSCIFKIVGAANLTYIYTCTSTGHFTW